jgi:hypothetical protein
MRTRLTARKSAGSRGAWARYYVGRLLQITGLITTLVAATAFFGTPSLTAMLRVMLAGVLLFLAGYALAYKDPRS